MARTATATKKAPAKKNTAGSKNKTTTTTSGLGDELSALASANKEMEDVERAKTGSQNSFITLVKGNSGILDKNNPAFIKGVKTLDYAIGSKKLALGKELDATIIGMFKIYAEVTQKESGNDMPKTVQFWMPDDAAQFPVTPGNNFDRQLPNGNVLQPCHWIFLYLHDHPEVEDALLAFRSKGNNIYAQLEKTVKAESSAVTELRFKITNQGLANEKYKKTDYYPKFEIVGRNYKFTEDGKVVGIKGSDVDGPTLKEILTRQNKMLESYSNMKMIAKKNVQAIAGVPGRAALPPGKGGYEDDEDDAVNF
jgi:hypothetical protein